MVWRNFLSLGLFFSLCVFLASCAGTEADLERARAYLEKGGAGNGARAADKVDNNLTPEKIESEKLSVVLRSARLFIGAKIAEAGFDSVDVITNLVYQEGDDTISALSSIVDSNASLATIRSLLQETDTIVTNILAREDVAAFDVLDATACAADADICGPLKSLYFVHGLRYLVESLAIATLETSFFEDEFSAEDCEQSFDGSENNLPVALLNARTQFNFADLDDNIGNTIDSEFTDDPDINTFIEFIDDVQTNDEFDVDGDYDGVLGTETDGQSVVERIQDLCDYISGQRSN